MTARPSCEVPDCQNLAEKDTKAGTVYYRKVCGTHRKRTVRANARARRECEPLTWVEEAEWLERERDPGRWQLIRAQIAEYTEDAHERSPKRIDEDTDHAIELLHDKREIEGEIEKAKNALNLGRTIERLRRPQALRKKLEAQQQRDETIRRKIAEKKAELEERLTVVNTEIAEVESKLGRLPGLAS